MMEKYGLWVEMQRMKEELSIVTIMPGGQHVMTPGIQQMQMFSADSLDTSPMVKAVVMLYTDISHHHACFLLCVHANYLFTPFSFHTYFIIGSVPFHRAHFGMGSGPILLGSAHCTGMESSVLECRLNVNNLLSCNHYEDAGVQCQGTVIQLICENKIENHH